MWLMDSFLVTFFGRWWGAVRIHMSHVQLPYMVINVWVKGAFTCGTYSQMEGTFKCGTYMWRGHSCVEGTFTCGSYSRVEGTFTCGSYSRVEGTFTCGSYSRVGRATKVKFFTPWYFYIFSGNHSGGRANQISWITTSVIKSSKHSLVDEIKFNIHVWNQTNCTQCFLLTSQSGLYLNSYFEFWVFKKTFDDAKRSVSVINTDLLKQRAVHLWRHIDLLLSNENVLSVVSVFVALC